MEEVVIALARLLAKAHDNNVLKTTLDVERKEGQETIAFLKRDNERLAYLLNVHEAEVTDLNQRREDLQLQRDQMMAQRDNLLRQHAMVCGQRDDQIASMQKLLRMMKDHIDTAMTYDKAMWESVSDVPTFHDLRAQYHRHDSALSNVLELITNNIDDA